MTAHARAAFAIKRAEWLRTAAKDLVALHPEAIQDLRIEAAQAYEALARSMMGNPQRPQTLNGPPIYTPPTEAEKQAQREEQHAKFIEMCRQAIAEEDAR